MKEQNRRLRVCPNYLTTYNLASPGNVTNDIYWVSTAIIENLKPKELK